MKMKTQLKLSTLNMFVLIAMIFGAALPARAHLTHHRFCHRPYAVRTVLDSKTIFTAQDCRVQTPLALVRLSHDYSFGVLMVDAWAGSFSRPTETTERVLHETYNCRGDLISSRIETLKFAGQASIRLSNPNMSDAVSTSFEAQAPMTDEEAHKAFSELKRQCESA
jgi:hypothetical protein